MEVISTTALISINATLVAQVLSFLIFAFLLNLIMFRPLQNTMRQREQRIEDIKQEVVTIQAEIEQIFNRMDAEEVKVKESALDVQHQLESEGKLRAREIFDSVKLQIEELKEQTRKSVQNQIQNVRQHLAEESLKLSKIIMDKALDRRLSNE